MSLLQPSSLRRGQAGNITIGIIERSVGYLQGGYYSGATKTGTRNDGSTWPPASQVGTQGGYGGWAWQCIQLYNCVNETGNIVSNTGFNITYYAGITGNTSGFYSYNENVDYQKFDYISITSSVSFSTIGYGSNLTFYDLGVYSQAWILSAGSATGYSFRLGSTSQKFFKVSIATETVSDKGALSTLIQVMSRQGMCNGSAAFGFGLQTTFLGITLQSTYALNYSTETVANAGLAVSPYPQIYCGMSVSNTVGYVIDTSKAYKFVLSGAGVTSYTSETVYPYQFGESHSLTSNTSGFMMAGYPDTTGRYYGVQHGLAAKRSFATEAVTALNDIQLPQSSGQMMQGF